MYFGLIDLWNAIAADSFQKQKLKTIQIVGDYLIFAEIRITNI